MQLNRVKGILRLAITGSACVLWACSAVHGPVGQCPAPAPECWPPFPPPPGPPEIPGPTGPPVLSPTALHALRIIDAFILLVNDPKTDNDPDIDASLNAALLPMGMVGGYDFKWDMDAWRCWYHWLRERDPSIAFVCLREEYPVAKQFATDVILSTGDTKLVERLLKERYQMDEWSQHTIAFAIAEYVKHPEGVRARLYPDDAFWQRFVCRMAHLEALWLPKLREL